MLKFTVLTILVVGLVVDTQSARRGLARRNAKAAAAKNIDKGEPSPSEESSHGSCNGCTFPWMDWNNDTHYGCTDFDGDAHWSV